MEALTCDKIQCTMSRDVLTNGQNDSEDVLNTDVNVEIQQSLDANTSERGESEGKVRRSKKKRKNKSGAIKNVSEVMDFQTQDGSRYVDLVIVKCGPLQYGPLQCGPLQLSKNARKKAEKSSRHVELHKADEITRGCSGETFPNSNNHKKIAPPKLDISSCKDVLELQSLLLRNHISSNSNKNTGAAQISIALPSEVKKSSSKVKKKIKEYIFKDYLDEDKALNLLKNHKLVEGALRINPKHYQTAYVSHPSVKEPDYLINGVAHRNRALDGDIVFLAIEEMPAVTNSDHTVQKTGEVVFIKQKIHPRTCVGFLTLMADKNRKMAIFKPRDHRMPRMYIPFTCWPTSFYEEHENYLNVLFIAKIVKWTDVAFAVGTIISNIGYCGELNVESKAILAENGLDVTPFTSDVQQFYPRLDYVIPQSEFQYRKDCRGMCIFTIDPLTARDLDDAVSCQLLENGNLEVGVHIADVSFFLKEGTILDEKVASKATTVYMVEKAYHMLPEDLCLMCSLLPGCDKLTFSVFWEFTKNGEMKNKYICRTVINSCTQLAYEHAQKIIDNPEYDFLQSELPTIHGKWLPNDISQAVKNLFSLSLIFKKQRFDSGALKIDQPKLCFQLDPVSGLPQSYAIYENKESHRLIEEFMLLANMTVAKQIYEDFPRLAFLRRHPPPNLHMLNELVKSLEPLGICLDTSTAGKLQTSLSHFSRCSVEDDGIALVLNGLIVKPMVRAMYFCADGCDDDDFWHYALNVPLYTHFTSPIRRYADIMVHRLLSASLDYSERPEWNVNDIHMIAANCNKQKFNAKRAGEMSAEMYIHMYISQNAPMLVKAVVIDVKMIYIDVIIIDNGLTKRLHLSKCGAQLTFLQNDKSYKLNKIVVTWPATNILPETSRIIELFSTVSVRLDKTKDPFQITSQLERPTD